MKKVTIEITESELKVIVNALQYAKSYKGLEVYEVVLKNLISKLKAGHPKYYLVQGILDDGICRYRKSVLVKARNPEQASANAKVRLEFDTGEYFTVMEVAEANRNYAVSEVI